MPPWHQHPPCILFVSNHNEIALRFLCEEWQVMSIFSGLNALRNCLCLMWLSSGHTQMLHGSHRPWAGQPDAHKDPSAKINEKEEKPELLFSHLHFKCVQDLGILDLIKWTCAFRIVGEQDVGKPLCPLGSGQRAELHQQCLHSHIPEWLSWENWTPSGEISAKFLIDGNTLMILWGSAQ